jgi:uncharacterized protein (TIGR03435 family)
MITNPIRLVALLSSHSSISIASVVPNGILAFEAVERELGLNLVIQKRSIPVSVVDDVDEKPLE